ncbi:MAG: DUF5719 family protein [Nocardioides sp.]
MSTPTSGRRTAEASRRPVAPALVLAVLLPLVTVGTLALVPTGGTANTPGPPELTELTRTSLGCPASHGANRSVVVGSATADEDGQVSLDPLDGAPRDVDTQASRLLERTLPGATVVTGEDDWAPGLFAARLGVGAAVACEAPAPEAWFTGVGARPQHSSVVELVNPDPGPAIADLAVLAPSGPLDVPAVRGIRVPGRSSIQLDLAQIVPRRTELAVQVVVSRGRLVSAVWDTVAELGAGPAESDWVPTQAAPATSGLLLGLPTGPGSRQLTIANGGTDEARVDVRIVAPESTFDPEGIDEIRVPPGSIQSISLDAVLAPEVRAGATGLLVEATHPVSASVRSSVGGDLSHTVAATPVRRQAAAAVPLGRARVVLAGADSPGVATVVSRAAGGRSLREDKVELGPDRSTTVRLPARTDFVSVELGRTTAVVSLVTQGPDGATVTPLREMVVSGLVPDVRPALR